MNGEARAPVIMWDAYMFVCVCIRILFIIANHFTYSISQLSHNRTADWRQTYVCLCMNFFVSFFLFFLCCHVAMVSHIICAAENYVWCCCVCVHPMRMCWTCVNLSVHNDGHSFYCSCCHTVSQMYHFCLMANHLSNSSRLTFFPIFAV